MVDMGVGENQAVDIAARAKAGAVQLEGLLALALKKTAVKKDAPAVDFEQVLGTGDGFRRAMEGDFHGNVSLAE
jgi:hypothetical protein